VHEWSLSTPYDVSTATYAGNIDFHTGQTLTGNTGFFDLNGWFYFVDGFAENTIYQYNLTTQWDINTATYSGNSFDYGTVMTSIIGSPQGIFINADRDFIGFVDSSGNDQLTQADI
jgi:hypothetical protein